MTYNLDPYTLRIQDFLYLGNILWPSTMAHAYNPSYLGGRDEEDHSLRPAQAKKFKRLHLSKKTGDDDTRYRPNSTGGIRMRITI
jgi:hypothetical protein